jgi:predicted metallopeptidase
LVPSYDVSVPRFHPQHELVLRWQALPQRAIHGARGRGAPATLGAPWHDTGPAGQPFDFGAAMRALIGDVVVRCPEFARIQTSKVLLGVTQARSGRVHGLQARVTPLRFANGQLVRQRHGVTYQVQRLFHGAQEFLYVMTFCMPRYLDQSFDDKLVTLFHELYHIHPEFSGDLRRHAGRCRWHTSSKHGYDKQMAGLARAYLNTRPEPRLHAFLRLNFAQLRQRHGSVLGVVVPRPKLIPIATPQTAAARSE